MDWIHLDLIDSTNLFAKTQIHLLKAGNWICITADAQSMGRATYGKKWVSPIGNLYMSLLFLLEAKSPEIPHLAQLFSFSTARWLQDRKIDAKIRWPNDILVLEEKLAGILVETTPIEEGIAVIIGIGMNVNAPIRTDQPTTSLIEIEGAPSDLEKIKRELISYFESDLAVGFSRLRESIEALLSFKGKQICCYVKGKKDFSGMLIGLSEEGELIVQEERGTLRRVRSGTTIRSG